MSTNDKDKKDDGFLNLIIFGGGIFFLFKLYEKTEPKVIHFWEIHRLKFLGFGGLILGTALCLVIAYLWNRYQDAHYEKVITSEDPTAVPLGVDSKDNRQFMKQVFRTSHTQVIGTTSCGKTESVILPWIIQDIKNGEGVCVVDPHGSFVEEIL